MTFHRRQFLQVATALAASVISSPVLAQSENSLERIKKSGVLRVGVTPAEPWFFKNPVSGEWDGVGVRLGKKMAEDLGVRFEPVETTWANAVAGLQAGQIDIMYVLDATDERRKAIDFPDTPLFYYALGALVREDNPATVWADFDKPDLRVGVTLGTSNDRIITGKLKSAQISRFANNDELVAAFAAKRVDAVGLFHPALIAQFSKVKMGKVILPKPVDAVPTSAGVRKEADGAFRDWVNEKVNAYYVAGVPQEYFDAYLKMRNIDPATLPGLMKENWN